MVVKELLFSYYIFNIKFYGWFNMKKKDKKNHLYEYSGMILPPMLRMNYLGCLGTTTMMFFRLQLLNVNL